MLLFENIISSDNVGICIYTMLENVENAPKTGLSRH